MDQQIFCSVVDGGAAVNLMSYVTLRKLGLGEEDLIQTDMMLTDFEGDVSPARGAIRDENLRNVTRCNLLRSIHDEI